MENGSAPFLQIYMSYPVKKKQEITLTIADLAFGGKGLARYQEYVIFVKDALPGQRVTVRVQKTKPGYAEARLLEVLSESPQQIKPPCPYFAHCGGCRFQNLAYAQQLHYLAKQVKDLYLRLGEKAPGEIQPIIGAEAIYRYRNKMEFSFAHQRWLIDGFETEKPTDFALGLRAPGNFWKSIDLDDCLIAPGETGPVLAAVRDFALAQQLTPYNQKDHSGFLRHLKLRKGQHTDQLMIDIVTYHDRPEQLKALVPILRKRAPNLRSLVNTIARNKGGTTQGDQCNLLWGRDYIEERLLDFRFRISPASFFQTNSFMAEKLYAVIRQLAAPDRSETVWDLYCGTGSIALVLAPLAKKVLGFEVVPAAVRDARQNAALNKIDNTRFMVGNLDKLFRQQPRLLKQLPRPEVMIIDPPRAGMHPKLVQDVLQINPSRLVYVSCNPATQVRDITLLTRENRYQIKQVQPVDMFPHTPHIEVVTLLEKS